MNEDRPAPPADTGPELDLLAPTLLLDGRWAAEGPLRNARRVRIRADVVRVRGHLKWPGCELSILARLVESEQATLDVSAPPVERSFDIEAWEPALAGTEAVPQGKPGAPGDAGQPGGRLHVGVGRIEGRLTLRADGAAGGHGQRGGRGAKPAKGAPGRDGVFTSNEPPAGPYGAYVVRGRGGRWYWEMAYGETGAAAHPGGDGGASGAGGAGGAGGAVTVLHFEPFTLLPDLSAAGGMAGNAGRPSEGGEPGEPGLGGRNKLFQFHWVPLVGSRWQKFADDPNANVREIVARFGLALRAATGAPSTARGKVPPQPGPALEGAQGKLEMRHVQPGELAGLRESGYLAMCCDAAELDERRGRTARALERYRWVAQLADGTEDGARRALGQRALERLRMLTSPEPRPALAC